MTELPHTLTNAGFLGNTLSCCATFTDVSAFIEAKYTEVSVRWSHGHRRCCSRKAPARCDRVHVWPAVWELVAADRRDVSRVRSRRLREAGRSRWRSPGVGPAVTADGSTQPRLAPRGAARKLPHNAGLVPPAGLCEWRTGRRLTR